MTEIFAAVDLGGTTISGALANAEGQIVCQRQVPTDAHEGPADVLRRIVELVQSLADQAKQQPAALGVGVPGLVDVRTGVTKFFPNLPTQWREVPAGDVLSDQLQCPVRLLNDVRTATLGELTYGHGQGKKISMVFFALGTGVGGGVAIDGELRLGPLGAAGELGHQTILANGPLCGCGNRGCLETLASGPAIAAEGVRLLKTGLAPKLHELVGGDAGRITPKEMVAAADAGDDAVRDAILRAAEYLGIGVANAVTILHPQLVVLGGGVAEMGAILIDHVDRVMRKRVGMFPTNDVRVVASRLGNRAGLLGAIALASLGVGSFEK